MVAFTAEAQLSAPNWFVWTVSERPVKPPGENFKIGRKTSESTRRRQMLDHPRLSLLQLNTDGISACVWVYKNGIV